MLYLRLLVAALFASVRARRDLVLENLALRHQLAVYTRGRRRPRLRRHDCRFWSLLARGWSGWRGTLVMVEPDTVVRGGIVLLGAPTGAGRVVAAPDDPGFPQSCDS